MIRKYLTMILAALLLLIGMTSASADIILEPMGVFAFTLGVDGNYERFTTRTQEDVSSGTAYIQCSCGAETHNIVTEYLIKPSVDCPYKIDLVKGEGSMDREGQWVEPFTISCTAADVPIPKGLYPFTITVKATCGDNTAWGSCVIPLKVGDGKKRFNMNYGSSMSAIIEDTEYSADIVYGTGDSNRVIEFIQKALAERGYYEYEMTGSYGEHTYEAVRRFQRDQGIPETGNCDVQTMSRLFRLYMGGSGVRYGERYYDKAWFSSQDWFREIGLRVGAEVQLIDLWTDIPMNIRVQAMGNHIDAEPVTANDTRALCRMYGAPYADEIDDSYRPMLLVVPSSGGNTQIVCSIWAKPHGAYTIMDNDFAGQICLYLRGSTVEGTDQVDDAASGHQDMIDKAVQLMDEKSQIKEKIEAGDVIRNENLFDKMPPVSVPTLVLPDGTAEDFSAHMKYNEPKSEQGTITYNVHATDLAGSDYELPGECILCFPYPEGMDQDSARKYRIIIHHEISEKETEVFKSEDGEIEFTLQGLCVRVKSFSPFRISIDDGAGNAVLPKTGDESLPLSLLFFLAAVSLVGLMGLARRRCSTNAR